MTLPRIRTEHQIGLTIIALLVVGVGLSWQTLQQLRSQH
jgi:hypothetical protein